MFIVVITNVYFQKYVLHIDPQSPYVLCQSFSLASGNNKMTIKFHRKLLKSRLKYYDENHVSIASLYSNFASFYAEIGYYDKAIEYYQKSLNILGESLDLFESKKKDSLNKLNFYDYCCFRVQESKIKSGILHYKIGNVYEIKEDYDRAIEFYEKCLDIRIANLTDSHIKIGEAYKNLGNVYEIKEDYDEAIEFYEKCLEIYKKKIPRAKKTRQIETSLKKCKGETDNDVNII